MDPIRDRRPNQAMEIAPIPVPATTRTGVTLVTCSSRRRLLSLIRRGRNHGHNPVAAADPGKCGKTETETIVVKESQGKQTYL